MKKWIVPLVLAATLFLNYLQTAEAGKIRKMDLNTSFRQDDVDISEKMTSKQAIAFLKRMIDNLNKEIAGVTANAQSNGSSAGFGETIGLTISESGRITLIKYEAGRTQTSEGAAGVNVTDSDEMLKGAKIVRSFYLDVINQNFQEICKPTNKAIVLKCLGATACIEETVPGTEKSKVTSLVFQLARDTSEADVKKTVEAFRSLIRYYSGKGESERKTNR